MRERLGKWRGEHASIGHGAHERRTDLRYVAVRWHARIVAEGAHEVCLIHKICPTALIAETFAPRLVGEEMRIQLSDTLLLHGTIVWANETNVEIRFPLPIDVAELVFAHDSTLEVAPPGKPPQEIACQGWLEIDRETAMVEVRDLSQGGAQIACDVAANRGQRVVLVVQGLAPVPGQILWREESKVGVAFDEPIPFDALIGWIVERNAQIGPHGQSRRWPRYSILLKTLAQLPEVAQPVEMIVHNISRGGVLVTCRRGLHVGDHVELGLGAAGPVVGSVVWSSEGHAGIEFNRTIDTHFVIHPLGDRAIPPILYHYVTGRRPGLKGRTESDG